MILVWLGAGILLERWERLWTLSGMTVIFERREGDCLENADGSEGIIRESRGNRASVNAKWGLDAIRQLSCSGSFRLKHLARLKVD